MDIWTFWYSDDCQTRVVQTNSLSSRMTHHTYTRRVSAVGASLFHLVVLPRPYDIIPLYVIRYVELMDTLKVNIQNYMV